MCNVQGPGSAAEETLIRLMDTYGSMLTSLCSMMLRDHHRAQDAVQETFIKVFRHMSQLPEVQSEKAWLIRIAMNTCRDIQRSAWCKHVFPAQEIPQAAVHPEDEGILEEVRTLPPRYRQVILLHYWQNMTADEIALALSISRATVYRRLDKARCKLKLSMERWAEP